MRQVMQEVTMKSALVSSMMASRVSWIKALASAGELLVKPPAPPQQVCSLEKWSTSAPRASVSFSMATGLRDDFSKPTMSLG